jgi:hypothetical protein
MPPRLEPPATLPPEFRTDLLWTRHKVDSFAGWRIGHVDMAVDLGYYTGWWHYRNCPVLMKAKGIGSQELEPWMSLTPSEIESQELGVYHARGHTVCAGLGLGWMALNLAARPEVTKVSVLERDPAVITLFHVALDTSILADDEFEKIEIIETDCTACAPEEKVDFLYADIWLHYAEPETLPQVRAMLDNTKAPEVYIWGQEIFLDMACRERFGGEGPWTMEQLAEAAEKDIKMPLLLPADRDYPAMVQGVIDNRITKGLPIDGPDIDEPA